MEGVADAAHGPASAARISQTQLWAGRRDLDRACFLPGAVHGFECLDRPELRQLAVFAQAYQAFRFENRGPAAYRSGVVDPCAFRSLSQTHAAPAASSKDWGYALGGRRPGSRSRLCARG